MKFNEKGTSKRILKSCNTLHQQQGHSILHCIYRFKKMVDDDTITALTVEMNKVNNHDGWLRVSGTHFSISTHSEIWLYSLQIQSHHKSWETAKWFLCLTPLVPGGQYGSDWCTLHHMSDLLATILSVLHFLLNHKISATTTTFNIVTLLLITYRDISLVWQVINLYHNLHHHHHSYNLVLIWFVFINNKNTHML